MSKLSGLLAAGSDAVIVSVSTRGFGINQSESQENHKDGERTRRDDVARLLTAECDGRVEFEVN